MVTPLFPSTLKLDLFETTFVSFFIVYESKRMSTFNFKKKPLVSNGCILDSPRVVCYAFVFVWNAMPWKKSALHKNLLNAYANQ